MWVARPKSLGTSGLEDSLKTSKFNNLKLKLMTSCFKTHLQLINAILIYVL